MSLISVCNETAAAMNIIMRYYAEAYIRFQNAAAGNPSEPIGNLPDGWAFDVVDELTFQRPLVALAFFDAILELEPGGRAFEQIAIGGMVHVFNGLGPADAEIAFEVIRQSPHLLNVVRNIWAVGLDEVGRAFLLRFEGHTN